MALSNPQIWAVAVMLDAMPELTGRLDIRTVPATFVEQRRFDGPTNEWILAEQVRRAWEE